jgi:hypothetical protein
MVGGIVKSTLDCGHRIWINVMETTCYRKDGCRGLNCKHDECAIYVERNDNSLDIKPGDKLWWQGRNTFWTSPTRAESEITIPRLGYSGVNHPAQAMMEAAGFA